LLPRLLDTLEFHFNNEKHQPIIDALASLTKHANSKGRAWNRRTNRAKLKIDWAFNRRAARRKFKYRVSFKRSRI
jgi:hypothetical protein